MKLILIGLIKKTKIIMRYYDKQSLLNMRITNDAKCYSYKFLGKNNIENLKIVLKSALKILNNSKNKKIGKMNKKDNKKRNRN